MRTILLKGVEIQSLSSVANYVAGGVRSFAGSLVFL